MNILSRLKNLLKLSTYVANDSPTVIDMSITYDAVGTVARCVDLLVNSCARIPFIVVEEKEYYYLPKTKIPKFSTMLKNPSTEYDTLAFFKNIYRDLIFKGSCLLYNTNLELQYIPNYSYNNGVYIVDDKYKMNAEECVFVNMLNSMDSKFAAPYISRISKELNIIQYMLKFQEQYFKNNGFPGVVLKTERPLSEKLKDRYLKNFKAMISIMQGRAGEPLLLDDNMSIENFTHSFKELEFSNGLKNLSIQIHQNLGIPDVLINGGNNANISPNVKLFYSTTVSDFVYAVASALTFHARTNYPEFKNLTILPDFSDVHIMQDDFATRSNSIKNLYTVGIISKEEARQQLKLPPPSTDQTFLTPANIAGSAVNTTEGGRPNA